MKTSRLLAMLVLSFALGSCLPLCSPSLDLLSGKHQKYLDNTPHEFALSPLLKSGSAQAAPQGDFMESKIGPTTEPIKDVYWARVVNTPPAGASWRMDGKSFPIWGLQNLRAKEFRFFDARGNMLIKRTAFDLEVVGAVAFEYSQDEHDPFDGGNAGYGGGTSGPVQIAAADTIPTGTIANLIAQNNKLLITPSIGQFGSGPIVSEGINASNFTGGLMLIGGAASPSITSGIRTGGSPKPLQVSFDGVAAVAPTLRIRKTFVVNAVGTAFPTLTTGNTQSTNDRWLIDEITVIQSCLSTATAQRNLIIGVTGLNGVTDGTFILEVNAPAGDTRSVTIKGPFISASSTAVTFPPSGAGAAAGLTGVTNYLVVTASQIAPGTF